MVTTAFVVKMIKVAKVGMSNKGVIGINIGKSGKGRVTTVVRVEIWSEW